MPESSYYIGNSASVRCVSRGTAEPQVNTLPTLTAENASVEYGTPLEDLLSKITYTATDEEDGDLTDQVIISSEGNYDPNTPGTYTITLSVTDTDGETVTIDIEITVLEKAEEPDSNSDSKTLPPVETTNPNTNDLNLAALLIMTLSAITLLSAIVTKFSHR